MGDIEVYMVIEVFSNMFREVDWVVIGIRC